MQERRVYGHRHYPMDLSHACKSINQYSHYFYPSTWMVSPGVEERKEMIDTTVGPTPKSKWVTVESPDVLTTPI